MESNKSVVIVVGAGSTYSDGENDSRTYMRPPVDRGFFRESNKDASAAKILGGVRASLMDFYDMDPLEENNDSLEGVLVKVYADMMSIGSVDRESREKLFMDLGYLLNMRMATTTNFLASNATSNIRRIISWYLDASFAPQDICLVTFNYDLHIEKNLNVMDGLKMYGAHKGKIFNFPHLYELGSGIDTTQPDQPAASAKRIPVFPMASSAQTGRVSLLKLHGSLNWYSPHTSASPSYAARQNPKRKVRITFRTQVFPDLTVKEKRKMSTYPVIVPPIIGKAGIFHERIRRVWEAARKRIDAASEVVIFGYSFPPADHESVNLLGNTVGKSKNCRHVSVINPDSSVVGRMGIIPKKKPVIVFGNTDMFLNFSRLP